MIGGRDTCIGSHADGNPSRREATYILLQELPAAHDRRVRRGRTAPFGGVLSELATGRGKHGEKATRERAAGWRFIRRESRDIACAALFEKSDDFVVDRRVADSVRKDIYSCVRGDLGPIQSDGMGEDFDSGLVCIFDDGREGFYIHVGQIVSPPVAPA